MTHTPGPWQVVKHTKGWHVACETHAIAETFGQSEPNARLIAAAPDLLAALVMLRKLHGTDSPQGIKDQRDIMDAAIAKARA